MVERALDPYTVILGPEHLAGLTAQVVQTVAAEAQRGRVLESIAGPRRVDRRAGSGGQRPHRLGHRGTGGVRRHPRRRALLGLVDLRINGHLVAAAPVPLGVAACWFSPGQSAAQAAPDSSGRS